MQKKENESSTKIIKTFRGEVILLATLITFVAGVLGAYYSLVKDIAVMKNDYSNQTTTIKDFVSRFDSHIKDNDKDHDILVELATLLKLEPKNIR